MTTDQLHQTAAAMTAYAAGKPVQFQIIGTSEWTDCPKPEWNCMAYVYRPKPEAKTQTELDYERFMEWVRTAKIPFDALDCWSTALAYERSRK